MNEYLISFKIDDSTYDISEQYWYGMPYSGPHIHVRYFGITRYPVVLDWHLEVFRSIDRHRYCFEIDKIKKFAALNGDIILHDEICERELALHLKGYIEAIERFENLKAFL